MPVRFVRQKNRTVADVFNNIMQPKIKIELQDVAQKIATYSKRNHTWKNRSGALEESINFTLPEKTSTGWIATVFAGGWAKVKWAFDITARREGRRRKHYRYQRKERIPMGRGTGVFVHYARFVEDKGFPVLKQGIEFYRHRIAQIFRQTLKVGVLR